MKIHHIGYLVKSIEDSIKEFIQLGYEIEENVICDKIRNINICFMKNNNTLLELVEPANGDSVVTNLMKRYKNSPYHICYECDNFDNKLKALILNGYMIIQEPNEAPAIRGRRVAFLINHDIGMIELLESR